MLHMCFLGIAFCVWLLVFAYFGGILWMWNESNDVYHHVECTMFAAKVLLELHTVTWDATSCWLICIQGERWNARGYMRVIQLQWKSDFFCALCVIWCKTRIVMHKTGMHYCATWEFRKFEWSTWFCEDWRGNAFGLVLCGNGIKEML